MTSIPLPSGIVNAFIFIVIDILALWAIHRGLLALQGYVNYRAAINGRPLVLRRSRIPIIAGELLSGSTTFSYIFQISLAAMIVFAFLGTLGINGETEKVYDVPIIRNYTTTLSSTQQKVFEMESAYIHVYCRESNASHMTYWPLAFNDPASNSSSRLLTPSMSSIICLRDVKGVVPMLSVRSCMPSWITCLSKDERGEANVRFSWSAPSFDVLYNLSNVPQLNSKQFRQIVSDDNASSPIIAVSLRVDNVGFDSELIPIVMPNDLMLAKRQRPDDGNDGGFLQAVRLRYHRNSSRTADVLFGNVYMSMSHINRLFTSNSKFDYSYFADESFKFQVSSAEATIEGEILEKGLAVLLTGLSPFPDDPEGSSLVDHLNTIVSNLLQPEPLTRQVYTYSNREATSINSLSLVLLAVLFAAGIILGGVREIMLRFVAGKSEEARKVLTAGEYGTLSEMYRAEIERHSDLPLSGLPMQLRITTTYENTVHHCAKNSDSLSSVACTCTVCVSHKLHALEPVRTFANNGDEMQNESHQGDRV